MNTSDKSDWELRGQYWQAKQKLERANTEWGHAQLARRVQLDRRIAALEDQLRTAGLDPVIEREQDRRNQQARDADRRQREREQADRQRRDAERNRARAESRNPDGSPRTDYDRYNPSNGRWMPHADKMP